MSASEQDTPSPSSESLGDGADEIWQLEAKIPGLREGGQHALAAGLGERLLEIREAALGASHDLTLAAAADLADTYSRMALPTLRDGEADLCGRSWRRNVRITRQRYFPPPAKDVGMYATVLWSTPSSP